MADNNVEKKASVKAGASSASKDLVALGLIILAVLIFSYYFNVFSYLVELFQKYPRSITLIDEIISGLVTLSLGLAVFAWRRWSELKKETAERIKAQQDLLEIVKTEAEIEKMITKQLHKEIELRKQGERNMFHPDPKMKR